MTSAEIRHLATMLRDAPIHTIGQRDTVLIVRCVLAMLPVVERAEEIESGEGRADGALTLAVGRMRAQLLAIGGGS